MRTYQRNPNLIHDKAVLFAEIKAIQGSYPIISVGRIMDLAVRDPETYPELARIITTNPEKSAKRVISLTLRENNYQRWNSTTGSSVSAVWREPCQ